MNQINSIVEYLNINPTTSKTSIMEALSMPDIIVNRYITTLIQVGYIVVFGNEVISLGTIEFDTLAGFESKREFRDHNLYYKLKYRFVEKDRSRFKTMSIIEKFNYLYIYENGKRLEYTYSNASQLLDITGVQFSYYASLFIAANYFKLLANGTYRHVHLLPFNRTPTKLDPIQPNEYSTKQMHTIEVDNSHKIAKGYLDSMEWLTISERESYINFLVEALLWGKT